jgi:drug/metabolite transporter (DMT)-like permease
LLVIFPAYLFKSLNAPLSVWLLGITAALLTVSGALALSKAFALGKAAIVAPLVTSYGVVTTLLSWASGEHISLIQLGCIGLCVIGVILSSIHKDNGVPHNNPRLSIAYALLAALLYGTSSGCKAATRCPHWARSPCCGWVTWWACACWW